MENREGKQYIKVCDRKDIIIWSAFITKYKKSFFRLRAGKGGRLRILFKYEVKNFSKDTLVTVFNY